MNAWTLFAQQVRNTTATVGRTHKVSYSYPTTKNGLANNYSVLGLVVSIETTKKRGWTRYETDIRVGYTQHNNVPEGFSNWYKDYKSSFGITRSEAFTIACDSVETHSQSKLEKAHEVGVIAGEAYVLTILNKYLELLFNDVDKEVITRQINELQSQLATLN